MLISPIHHAFVIVEDLEESLYFYRDILGWKVLVEGELEGNEISKLVGLNDVEGKSVILQQASEVDYGMIELIRLSCPERPAEKVKFNQIGLRGLSFRVKDIEQACADLKEKGIKFYSQPQVVNFPGYRIKSCMFSDPNGVILEIIQFIGQASG